MTTCRHCNGAGFVETTSYDDFDGMPMVNLSRCPFCNPQVKRVPSYPQQIELSDAMKVLIAEEVAHQIREHMEKREAGANIMRVLDNLPPTATIGDMFAALIAGDFLTIEALEELTRDGE